MSTDALIDAVARDMTDVRSREDLGAVVLARLDARAPRPWLRIALPAAVAATVIAAFALTRSTTVIVNPQTATPPVVQTGAIAAPAGPAQPARARASQLRVARAAVSAEEQAWRARAVAPLEPASPLGIEAIQPTWMQIAPMSVEPIAVDPISLPPLGGKSGERDR